MNFKLAAQVSFLFLLVMPQVFAKKQILVNQTDKKLCCYVHRLDSLRDKRALYMGPQTQKSLFCSGGSAVGELSCFSIDNPDLCHQGWLTEVKKDPGNRFYAKWSASLKVPGKDGFFNIKENATITHENHEITNCKK